MKNKISTKKIKEVLMNIYLLNWKLSEKGIFGIRLEGNSGIFPPYINDIVKYAKISNIKNILDIGFNLGTGHTAVILLSANKTVNVISFDLGSNYYISISKKFIDSTFQRRHKLIVGNSMDTIPTYHKKHKKHTFDLIIIDGNHEHKNIIDDIKNCKLMAHNKTIVIINNTIVLENKQIFTPKNTGPTKALDIMVKTNQLKINDYHKYNNITGISICSYIN